MAEDQKAINEWANSVGIRANLVRALWRAREELNEAIDEAMSGRFDKCGVEIADTVICLYVAAERANVDLQTEIDKKMEINRKRKWRIDATGSAYHVKDSANG